MGYMLNGCDTGGFPFYLIKPLLEKYEINYFCETGTASGLSVREAAKLFKKCWTIELIEGRQDIKDAQSNISFLEGDSTELLQKIIEELIELKGKQERQYVLFYLDAHYSDIVPNETGYPECPVLREIECIAEYGEDAIIIIDDARLFFGQPPYPHDPREWPSISEIIVLLKEKFPYSHVTIVDDYVLSIPLHVRDVLDREWVDRYSVRYPNEEERLRMEMRNVYNHLKIKFDEFIKYISE